MFFITRPFLVLIELICINFNLASNWCIDYLLVSRTSHQHNGGDRLGSCQTPACFQACIDIKSLLMNESFHIPVVHISRLKFSIFHPDPIPSLSSPFLKPMFAEADFCTGECGSQCYQYQIFQVVHVFMLLLMVPAAFELFT